MDTQVKIGGDEEELEEDIFEKEEDDDEDDEVGFDDDDNYDDGDEEVRWSGGWALWIFGWKLDVVKMRRMFLMVMIRRRRSRRMRVTIRQGPVVHVVETAVVLRAGGWTEVEVRPGVIMLVSSILMTMMCTLMILCCCETCTRTRSLSHKPFGRRLRCSPSAPGNYKVLASST